MVADDSALVFVLPEDKVDTIISKVRNTGATNVQLLVPDGATALQTAVDVERLRHSAERDHIDLLVISSDEKILDAARRGQIETVGVSGTRVMAPAAIPSVVNGGVAAPIADEEILAAIDDLPDAQDRDSTQTPARSDYDAFAAELDTWGDLASGQISDPRTAPDSAYDAFAAELDTWGDLASGRGDPADDAASAHNAETITAGAAFPPRARIRPEDIELTDEEKRRASNIRSDTRQRRKSAPSPHHGSLDAEQESGRSGGRPWFMRVLPLVLILLLLVIIFFIFFGGRGTANGANRSGPLALVSPATVIVNPPVPLTAEQTFTDQPIFLVDPGAEATDTAVQALPISADVEFTANGQVTSETQAPASSASGTVTLFSQNSQPIDLPQGTQFIATNPAGQEVRFASDAPVTIPPATVSDQGAQIITTRGQAQVNVTALAPGSASNVEENTITAFVIPGQPPIPVNTGALLLNHPAITGGSEQTVRIVKDEDVQQALGQALTGLDNQAREALQAQLANRGDLVVEHTTITPRGNEITSDESYALTVDPPVGTTLEPANANFSVTVRATYQALATPQGNPLQNQLQAAVPNQLAAEDKLPAATSPGITGWRWDGSTLRVDGVLRPSGEESTLDAGTRGAILTAIKGKSHVEAQAALDYFVQEGIISSYTLPDVDQLPRWSFLLDLQVEQAGA